MKFVKDKTNRINFKMYGYKYILNRYLQFRFDQRNYLYLYFGLLNLTYLGRSFVSKFKYYCVLTFRASSVFSFFKLSRVKLKNLASFGEIIGLRKSSW